MKNLLSAKRLYYKILLQGSWILNSCKIGLCNEFKRNLSISTQRYETMLLKEILEHNVEKV